MLIYSVLQILMSQLPALNNLNLSYIILVKEFYLCLSQLYYTSHSALFMFIYLFYISKNSKCLFMCISVVYNFPEFLIIFMFVL